ncbi:MAG: energy transducer TonB [Pseudomonadota bacterium]
MTLPPVTASDRRFTRRVFWITSLLGLALLTGCVGASNRPLQLVSGAGPVYPAEARAAGVEGDVEVRYRVTETGTVADPEVVRAAPPGVFDEAALTAIRQFRYRPQLKDGTPVAVPAVISTIRFRLDEALEYELPPAQ